MNAAVKALVQRRDRLLGKLGVVGLVLLIWNSALFPLPFQVGIGRPLRMRFEYRIVELRVVVDPDVFTREVWVWIPFDGWKKKWSGSCGIPEAGHSAGERVGIPTWDETAWATEEVAATVAPFSFPGFLRSDAVNQSRSPCQMDDYVTGV